MKRLDVLDDDTGKKIPGMIRYDMDELYPFFKKDVPDDLLVSRDQKCNDPTFHTKEAQAQFCYLINQTLIANRTNDEVDLYVFDPVVREHQCAICWYIRNVDSKGLYEKEQIDAYESIKEKQAIENKNKALDQFIRKLK